MSELSEVWRFLFESVTTVFCLSVDFIATILYIVAILPPWRWLEVINDTEEYNYDDGKWKWKCLFHFFITVLDFILIPFVLLTCLSPSRYWIIPQGVRDADEDDKSFSKRFHAFSAFCYAMFDVISVFICFFGLFSPLGRQMILINACNYHTVGNWDAEDTRMNKAMIALGINGIFDVLYCFPSFIILFVPTVWRPTLYGFKEIESWKPRNRTEIDLESWTEFFDTKRIHLVNQELHALIDIVTLPFLLFAFLSPWRNSIVRELLWPSDPEHSEFAARHDQPVTVPRDDAERSRAATTIFAVITKFVHHYNAKLRIELIYQGMLALLDYLLLPLILPLFLTYYRFIQLKDELLPPATDEETPAPPPQGNVEIAEHSEGDKVDSPSDPKVTTTRRKARVVWTHKELLLILQQFSLLVTDIVFFAFPLLILFLTQFRWHLVAPVFVNWREEKLFLKRTSDLYFTIGSQFLLLLCDVFSLPLLLVVLITFYRWPILWNYLSLPIVKKAGLQFHLHILINFFIVLHDLVLYLPFLLLMSLFAFYRSYYSLSMIFPSFFVERYEQEKRQSNQQYDVVHTDLPVDHELGQHSPSHSHILDATDHHALHSSNLLHSADTLQQQQQQQQSDVPTSLYNNPRLTDPFYCYSDEFPFRSNLWDQIIQSIFDLPLIVLTLILICTGWRLKNYFLVLIIT
jgi:hypothetical protein